MKLTVYPQKKHPVSPYLTMQFAEPLGTADSSVDAGWDFQKDCWHPFLVEKVRELAPKMIRFGGCFASYYHWREAVGEERIPMYNLCWDGIYSNVVGIHELVDLCRQVEAEPLLVVNMESDGRKPWAYPRKGGVRLGTAQEAADWVRYCNDEVNGERTKNGAEAPFSVKWWQIGNETSYDPAGFHSDKGVEVTARFAEEMLAADPSLSLIGWGDGGWGDDTWTRKMCTVDGLSHVAIHHHFDSGLPDSPLHGTAYRDDPGRTREHLLNAHKSLSEHLQKVRADLGGGKRLALTEGHFALPGRNRCEVLSSWSAGAAYARCLNVIYHNSDVLDIATMADFFGNRWQVNALILPTPAGNGKPYLQPVGRVMSLFGRHTGAYYAETSLGNDPDVTAGLSEDGSLLYLHLVNPSAEAPMTVELDLPGYRVERGDLWEIAADGAKEITEEEPDLFAPQKKEITGTTITLAPAAVAVAEMRIREELRGENAPC